MNLRGELSSASRYARANADQYRLYARVMAPNLSDPDAVWDRLAFAILTANAGFDSSVRALGVASAHRGHVTPEMIAPYQMVPAKAEYLNALPVGPQVFALLKGRAETWDTYRMRLTELRGLAMAKASFAACLLYPLEADLACVDTWMQKIFLGHQSFKRISRVTYMDIESKVRRIAKGAKVNTFLAQWMIWDHARGSVSEHDVFPGGHKGNAEPSWVTGD